jgi:hypothetical protein
MPDKKSNEPTDKALEQRVDEMMDTEKPTPPDEAAAKPPAEQITIPDLPPEANLTETEAPGEPIPNLDDATTDKAVDEIAAKEADTVLAVDDAKATKRSKPVGSGGGWQAKLKSLAKDKRTWAVVAVVLIAIFAVPVTRYKVLGLVIKKPVTITVLDSKTGTPVSSAQVSLGGDSSKTDADGKAQLKAAVGSHQLLIKKQYYRDLSNSYFVSFSASSTKVKVTATGRLVPVTVTNKVTGKPLAGVTVKVLKTTAKTNSKGQATIALPATAGTNAGKLSLSGYNATSIIVQVTDQVVKANSFSLTPTGHVYFLSNRSGKLDVVRTNLDGSDRKTVLEGTGNEEKNTTSLLASRDWHYLVLKAKRDGPQAALYLIDTSNDKVSQFDNGDADFTLVGWYEHNFVYALNRNKVDYWQAAKQAIKSYDADHQQLNQLDQSQAEGAAGNYAYQNFANFYILKNAVVYTTQWYTYNGGYSGYDTTGKNDTIRAVSPTGQNKKDYQNFPTATTGYIQAALFEPQGVYYAVYNNSTNKVGYYEYEDQAVKTIDINQAAFDQGYPTYLLSPTGNQTFWSELRDGKNALFTGDANAGSKKQLASLSDYTPYGWYGDGYVLVAKNSSELYISTPASLTAGHAPLKVTDYYKPAQNYPGYGYGYGGL